ncbi:ArnT family glycosyltransferase [Nocardia sp. NPDC058666]|uniref:ArnT family glycosyltransferase n=1 Tax=Nocardia sp. NPDC058666 TaxID=3346587 RepID=UPI0036506779
MSAPTTERPLATVTEIAPAPTRFTARRKTQLLVAVLTLCSGVVTAIGITGYPIRFGDEGVYIAQAWAIPNLHALAHYTYWYDHPPMGWVQMSIWFELTRSLQRWSDNTVMAGREFMVVVRMATAALLFVLARRLGMRNGWAALAVMLFVFSPLAVHYGRMVLLDNIALAWLLASFALALSPRRRWGAAVGAAVCFTVAVTTKETLAIAAPALAYALWRHYRGAGNREYVVVSFAVVFVMSVSLYPLFAAIKNELLPGPGHVSLWEAIEWQLSARAGSGSILDAGSDVRMLIDTWLALDLLLPVGGVIATATLIFVPRWRPVAVLVAFQLAMLVRGGYVPAMYVVTLLPFLALALAAVADLGHSRLAAWSRTEPVPRFAVLALVAALIAYPIAATTLAHTWPDTLHRQFTLDEDRPEREAVAWIAANIPRDALLVTESELWLDLLNAGFDARHNVWVYKVDSDPGVATEIGNWTAIDYLALSAATISAQSPATMPWVFTALDYGRVLATFGEGANTVTVLKVDKTDS